jgi:hypothetical protein
MRCPISDDAESSLTWHHLDEDATNSYDDKNLIRISASLNSDLENRHIANRHAFLKPEYLDYRSRRHYDDRNYAYAYACCILGANLAIRSPRRGRRAEGYWLNPDGGIYFSAKAIVNLRPLNEIDHTTYVLKTYVIPTLENHFTRIQPQTLVLLVVEIALDFVDRNDAVRGHRLLKLAETLLKRVVETTDVMTLRVRILQNRGITLMANHPARAGQFLARSEPFITARYPNGNTNLALYSAIMELQRERPDLEKAEETLRPYIEVERHIAGQNAWTAAEVLLTRGEISQMRGDRDAAEWIHQGRKHFKLFRTVPTRAIIRRDYLGMSRRALPPNFIHAVDTIEALITLRSAPPAT